MEGTAMTDTHINNITVDEEETYYQESNDDNEILDDNSSIDRKIVWQAKDFSIREFVSMEQDGELILQPEYQRKYVMDKTLASRLIESILLDVPIPVIYLAEESNGSYSVIDGQQRLTSFISFVTGKFPDKSDFTLSGLKLLSENNRKKFSELDKEAQSKIKTATIHTIVIKKESHDDIKFEIFERLNTGSIKLNEDEIRNTIYRGNYIKLLAELEENGVFHSIIKKDNFKKRMIYRGMILRFFALSEKSYLNYKPSMKQFCNKELRDFQSMGIEKQNEYKERFKKSIELSNLLLGDKSFRRFIPGDNGNSNGKWSTNRINMGLFDVVMCGFVHYEKHQIIQKLDEIREALIRLMSYNDEFINTIEIKTSDRDQLVKRFEIWFAELKKIMTNVAIDSRIFTFNMKKQLYMDDQTCKLCNQQIQSIDDAEVDHILPYSQGGQTVIENAQITHRYCNRKKGNTVTV